MRKGAGGDLVECWPRFARFAFGDGEVEAFQDLGRGRGVEVVDRRPGVEVLHLE